MIESGVVPVRQVDRALESLGGQRAVERGVGDDMEEGGLEAGVERWREEVRTSGASCMAV
eukprot:2269538-Pyramimonas_sp.AAC.1